MNYEIRPFTQEEWTDFCRIRSESYHAPYDALIKQQHRFHLPETRCLFEDGQMKATGRLIRYEQYLHGQTLPMGGVASIAIPLEERSRGHLRKILRQMLEEMREQRMPVSCLFPSVYAIYRRFGWEIVSELRTVTAPIERDGALIHPSGASTGQIRRGTRADEEVAIAIYERAMSGQNGAIKRTRWHWDTGLFQNKYDQQLSPFFIWSDEQGEAQGYLILDPLEDKTVQISELIALTGDAMRGLLGLVQRDNVAKNWTWDAPLDSILPALLQNPKIETQIQPKFMARIVDVTTAWTYVSPSAVNGNLHLGVSDPRCEWNEGTWTVTVEGGQATVASTLEPAHASSDIGTWTQLFYGYLDVDQTLFSGKLRVHDQAALPQLRALWSSGGRIPFMPDAF